MVDLPKAMKESKMPNRYTARLAGAMFLLVIAAVLASTQLQGGALRSNDIAGTLRTVAAHTSGVRASIVLQLLAAIATMVLAAMLYAVTRRQCPDLSVLALACRGAEAGLYAVKILGTMVLLSLSAAPATGDRELATVVVEVTSWSTDVGATFFAVGSTIFAYLLLKARSIPVPLAVLGMAASLLLVAGVPAETAAGHTTAEGASIVMWLPMFAFEITTGCWLLAKGARTPTPVPLTVD
jgi:uncharacterized protein DUF4386